MAGGKKPRGKARILIASDRFEFKMLLSPQIRPISKKQRDLSKDSYRFLLLISHRDSPHLLLGLIQFLLWLGCSGRVYQ